MALLISTGAVESVTELFPAASHFYLTNMSNLLFYFLFLAVGWLACYAWARRLIKRAESSAQSAVRANQNAAAEIWQLNFALKRAHAEMRKWQNAPSSIEAIVRGRMS